MEPRDAAPSGDAARTFLAALAADPRARIETPVLLVVAHPDDETLILGGQIGRLPALEIVTVTDGAPERLDDARAAGFSTREAYAEARRAELAKALAIAGLPADAAGALGYADQTAAHRLTELVGRIAAVLGARAPRVVITHALEGGHPDHDATGLAVRGARAMLQRSGGTAPDIVEAPLYRAASADPADGEARLSFPPGDGPPETVLALDEEALRTKRQMRDAHATQAATLTGFPLGTERLRPAAAFDTQSLPNCGALLYERHPWGVDGPGWLAGVAAAREALSLPRTL